MGKQVENKEINTNNKKIEDQYHMLIKAIKTPEKTERISVKISS